MFNQMLRRFSKYWDRIDIISPAAPGATERVAHGNVHLHPSPWPKLFQPWFILSQGERLLSERHYDLMTTQDGGLFYNGIGAWILSRRCGLPYVSEIHQSYPVFGDVQERFYRSLALLYLRWVWRWAAAIRVVNPVSMPDLLRSLGVPDEKILPLPAIYLDFGLFHPMPEEPRQYDLIAVARLVASKGYFILLDALAQVKTTHPSVKAVIVGRGPMKEAIQARIARLHLQDNVTLMEPMSQPDLGRCYNRAAMLVCPSYSEGSPRAPAEAMACGLPVIATPVGTLAETLSDGVNGVKFDGTPGNLADKIRLLMDNEAFRQRIGETGRQSVQPWQADAMIERYAHAYYDLISRLANQARK